MNKILKLLRLLPNICLKFFRHPIVFFRGVDSQTIRNFLFCLKRDDAVLLKDKMNKAVDRGFRRFIHLENGISDRLKVYKDLDGSKELVFKEIAGPLVSIIVPAHNLWKYNYACLYAILSNSEGVSYEVIFADDCSCDRTKNIMKYVKGIRVMRNNENMGFLRTCNKASKLARGKYVLFLNNDTNVQPNWLDALIELIEVDDKIGMIGSKLVYPDGRLQEAGGVFWRGASAWNFGRFDDPDKPEYNYVKEVDYISGASIMIRRDLWEEIGGFDERYLPAYCEDADLAFEVRKSGYKVVYQPKSVVVHFEGISHGVDEKGGDGNGMKKYQVDNKIKFFEKWRDVLERDHFESPDNIFLARDRSKDRKTILVIDHYVPHYDRDAGSRTMFDYLKLLVEMGYNVKFLGDNFYYHEGYTQVLEQIGIEVLYGTWYRDNWKVWFKSNAKYIDIVFGSRPHIFSKYVDFIKENSNAKIVYYGHDLHYLSLERRGDLIREHRSLKEIVYWKNLEFDVFSKVDLVYSISQHEVDIIKSELPGKEVRFMPVFIYDNFVQPIKDFNMRKDIVFVANFGREPNEDAAICFTNNVFKQFLEINDDVNLYLIGSNPTDKVSRLAGKNVFVTGYVSDAKLQEFYSKARLAVIPIRFGSGLKGKTIEAMYHGLPIVSTGMGLEGLPGIGKGFKANDSDQDFLIELDSLYKDARRLVEMSAFGVEYVKNIFSKQVARDLLRATLKI